MLLFSLQLSSGTFAIVYSLACEIDRLSADNWFSNHVYVCFNFSLTGLSMGF